MRELEVYLLKAIRECNRRILEIEQGKELGKTHGKLRDGGEYGTVNYFADSQD